jgi:pimeloyl-ACP methyl ester carboxylesterase
MDTASAGQNAVAPKKQFIHWRRLGRRLLRIAVVAYVLLCVIVYFAQDWIAFPGMMDQGKPETRIQYGGATETLHLMTSSGTPIAAVFAGTGNPDSPTILYFYGNAGAIAWSEGEFNHFNRLGCNVLIPDLSGYGASGGKPSEKNFYATADAAWDYLQTRPGIDNRKIIAVGWSMGAGVAVDLASRKPVAGLATFNAFTNLPAMARKTMPLVPTGLLLKYKFDNAAKIPAIHCPIFICNGQLDTLVPPEMSDQLAATAGGPVTRMVIPTADHNSIFLADPDMVWSALGLWIEKFEGAKAAVDAVNPGV